MMEGSSVTGNLILSNHTTHNSKGPQQKRTLEMEAYSDEPPQQDSSPAEKKRAVDPTTLCETAVAGAYEEINMLFSKFRGDVLSDRVAVDSSQMRELEGILLEAKSLEYHLKEKKKHLQRTLAHITDKLTG